MKYTLRVCEVLLRNVKYALTRMCNVTLSKLENGRVMKIIRLFFI